MKAETWLRSSSLDRLVEMLKDQQTRKVDMVVPADAITALDGGNLTVRGAEKVIDENGVTDVDGMYEPTTVFQEGVAGKFGIPVGYVHKTWAERPDIWAANVNGWISGWKDIPGDHRRFLVRAFTGTADQPGIARSLNSDSFKIIDHLDVTASLFQGINDAGVNAQIVGCDLSERFMRIRIQAPEVVAYAPELLKRYRSPFTGQTGLDNPTVFAGLDIANSETGCGAYTITPRLVVQVCSNGLRVTKDAYRAVHLGSKMDEGVIRWSDDTQRTTLELIRLKTVDAIKTFLDADYMQKVLVCLEEKAGVQVTSADKTIKHVGKSLQFTEAQIDGILDAFIQGGDLTAGGVLHAVTAFAQTVQDPEEAAGLEASAFRALEVAAA